MISTAPKKKAELPVPVGMRGSGLFVIEYKKKTSLNKIDLSLSNSDY